MEKLRGMNVPMPKFLQEDIPDGVKNINGYKNLQTFFPTLSKVFRVNKFQAPLNSSPLTVQGPRGFVQ